MALPAEFMRSALEQAGRAGALGEVPVGAVVVREDRIIAAAHNRTIADQRASAHAEILVLDAASRALDSWRLHGCTLYVTLEPCAMCAGAIVLARVGHVVFGAWDDKAGMAGSVGDLLRHPKLNHRPEVQGGLLAAESSDLLREFFAKRRGADFVDSPNVAG